MKKKIFMLLAFVMATMTASASAGFDLTVGTNEHGTIAFTVGGESRDYADEGEVVTVTITPDEGYVVNEPSGQWYAAIAAVRSQAPSVDLLNSINLTPVSGKDNQWTFKMARANAEISCTYKKVIQASWIQDITAPTYTGQALTPTVTVKDGSVVLVKDVDYTVTYSNNTNAALSTAATNAPTVTITAVSTSEQYAGTASKTFTINPATLTAALLEETNLVYNKAEQSVVVASVTAGTLDVPADGYDVTENSGTNVGNYAAKVTGKGNFTGEVEAPFSIIPADAKLFTLTVSPDVFTYSGTAQVPTVTVKDGNDVLEKDKDYTLTITNNVNAGTATVTAVGKGNYVGTQTVTFTIIKDAGSIAFAVSSVEKVCGDPVFTVGLTVQGDGSVSYGSDDNKVATVDEKGRVTVLRAGTATITATLGLGANYQGAETSFLLTVSEKVIKESTGLRITWDVDGYHYTINENKATAAVVGTEYSPVASVTYTRTLRTAGKTAVDTDGEQRYLSTVCTPFAPYFDAKYYTLSSVEGSVLRFTEIEGEPRAYTPYVVATTKDVAVTPLMMDPGTEIPYESSRSLRKASGSDEVAVKIVGPCFDYVVFNGPVIDGYQLKGTMRGMGNADAAGEGAYILQPNGEWGAVKTANKAAYIPPFRAYVVAQNAGIRLDTAIDGSEATSVGRIVTVDRDGSERWYDLQGRPVGKSSVKGVYIHGGKKVMVK